MDHWVQILMIRQNKYNIQNNVQKPALSLDKTCIGVTKNNIVVLAKTRSIDSPPLSFACLSVSLSFSFLSPDKLRHVKSEQFSQQASHK